MKDYGPRKCVDCGEPLDFRKGVIMRTPLDARMVCLPCGRAIGKTQEMWPVDTSGTDRKVGNE